jgi:hypothetical protein
MLKLSLKNLPTRPPTQITLIWCMALEVWNVPVVGTVLGWIVMFLLWLYWVASLSVDKEVDIFDDYLQRQERLVKQAQER